MTFFRNITDNNALNNVNVITVAVSMQKVDAKKKLFISSKSQYILFFSKRELETVGRLKRIRLTSATLYIFFDSCTKYLLTLEMPGFALLRRKTSRGRR